MVWVLKTPKPLWLIGTPNRNRVNPEKNVEKGPKNGICGILHREGGGGSPFFTLDYQGASKLSKHGHIENDKEYVHS